ncbi:hypothetical protein PoB_007098000 [Plakobranchus ocellatus]|uniref:Uncharacterized protein n=1 Tax=Plakobranchus ocellatus TaxID=259542 RepID=A0AAV4DKD8_9GAST|nr:hypothetical protein PoB_007098000 [Plakobranchus ocellatus]
MMVNNHSMLDSTLCRSTTRSSQDFNPSVRPGRRGEGSNPRQKGPCRSQEGFATHYAADATCKDEKNASTGSAKSWKSL